MNEIVKVQNIFKTFSLSKKQQKIQKTTNKRKIAVNDLSFSAYRGEIYGLLGPNGAGKTTALRILSTLIKCDSGDAFVNGFSVKNSPDDVRKNIGFLTSELKLDKFFTPNYLFDFFAKLYNINKDDALKRKNYLFNKFGIEEFKEVKVGDLSTGMLQKTSLVISIIHDPEIIIFDEPTNGLDLIVARTVTEFLKELKLMGKTIILSTHIFSLAEMLCDRIGIIIDGKMVLEDSIEHITKDDFLENVFFKVYKENGGVLE